MIIFGAQIGAQSRVLGYWDVFGGGGRGGTDAVSFLRHICMWHQSVAGKSNFDLRKRGFWVFFPSSDPSIIRVKQEKIL